MPPINPAAASSIKPQGSSLNGDPWREYIGGGPGNNWEGALANDGSQDVEIVEVPWANRITEEKNIIGWPARTTNTITVAGTPVTVQAINRNLPFSSPYHPGRMWAARAAPVKGIGPHKDARGQPLKESVNLAGVVYASRAVYETARLTVLFTQRPYNLYTDDYTYGNANANPVIPPLVAGDAAPEKYRWVERKTKTSMRFTSIRDNIFAIAEGPYVNKPIQGGPGKIEARTDVTLIWHEVPAQCVEDLNTGLLTNINKCVGKVNLYAWPNSAGYAPGTILVEAPDKDPILAAVDPPDLQVGGIVNNIIGQPSLIYKISLHLIHFDPLSSSPNGWRGHNLVPSPDDFNYYLATCGPGAVGAVSGSGKPYFPTTSISLLSHGKNLPQAVINVVSTNGITTGNQFTAAGSFTVLTTTGLQTVTYTGTTGTSFTGCGGGTGSLYFGNVVQQVDPGGAGANYGKTTYDWCDLNLLFFLL